MFYFALLYNSAVYFTFFISMCSVYYCIYVVFHAWRWNDPVLKNFTGEKTFIATKGLKKLIIENELIGCEWQTDVTQWAWLYLRSWTEPLAYVCGVVAVCGIFNPILRNMMFAERLNVTECPKRDFYFSIINSWLCGAYIPQSCEAC